MVSKCIFKKKKKIIYLFYYSTQLMSSRVGKELGISFESGKTASERTETANGLTSALWP